jgi:hypothetical protein
MQRIRPLFRNRGQTANPAGSIRGEPGLSRQAFGALGE